MKMYFNRALLVLELLIFLFDIMDSPGMVLFSMSGLEDHSTHLAGQEEIQVSSLNMLSQVSSLAGRLSTLDTLPHIAMHLSGKCAHLIVNCCNEIVFLTKCYIFQCGCTFTRDKQCISTFVRRSYMALKSSFSFEFHLRGTVHTDVGAGVDVQTFNVSQQVLFPVVVYLTDSTLPILHSGRVLLAQTLIFQILPNPVLLHKY